MYGHGPKTHKRAVKYLVSLTYETKRGNKSSDMKNITNSFNETDVNTDGNVAFNAL